MVLCQLNPEYALSIFKAIPGTGSYWKQFKNDLFARLEQHGNFHLFFTLSCAEKKWSEVIVAILQTHGINVTYDPEKWDGEEDSIFVTDPQTENSEQPIKNMPLPEYRKKIIPKRFGNMTNFIKDHFLLITRIFDNRVKAFIKNIIMAKDVEFYTYRVEMQGRGEDQNYMLK